MKLVYVVDDATYRTCSKQLDALDRSLNALSLNLADEQCAAMHAELTRRGSVPIVIPDDLEDALRAAGAVPLLAKTHLAPAEARSLREQIAKGLGADLVKANDSNPRAHLVLLEPS